MADRYTDDEIQAQIEWLERKDHRMILREYLEEPAAMLRQLLAERDAALAEVKAHEDAAEDRAIARDLARMPRNVR